ncbi:MAG: transcription-repair coupling factor family protein, partial [Coriobacteriia bacterium]
MSLLHLVRPAITRDPAVAYAATTLAAGGDVSLAVAGLVRPALVASLVADYDRPVLIVVPGEDTADRFARQLEAYLPTGRILSLPVRADMPWDTAAPDLEVVGRRARALHALDRGRPVVVVASARALMRALPPQGSHVFDPLVITAGGTLDLIEAAETLARMGYERVDVAEERGQFAVRGGTLDVFGSDSAYPVRAELFGDEVESIKRYVPTTQQTIGETEEVSVFACRDVALGTRAAQAAHRALEKAARDDDALALDLERIAEGIYFNGVEEYLPLFYKTPGRVLDYVPPSALVIVAEPRSLFDDAVRYHDEVKTRADAADIDIAGLFLGPASIDLGDRQRLTMLSVLRAGGATDGEVVSRRPDVAGGESAFLAGVRALISSSNDVIVTARDHRGRRALRETLTHAGFSVVDLVSEPDAAHPARAVLLAEADVPAGFVLPGSRLAVVSVDDVYPRATKGKRSRVEDPT